MPLSFGAELRSRRLAAGVSLTRFATVVNYSKSHISKIENGTKLPGVLLARLCDAALDAGGELAALAPPLRPLTSAEADADNVRETSWILELEATGHGRFAAESSSVGWTAPADQAPYPRSGLLLDAFRTQFDNLRRMTQSLPPAAMIPALVTGTHAVRMAARSAPEPSRSRLLLLAGHYAELTGWMAQEGGDDAGAIFWTDLAVRCAVAGGDHRIAAYAHVRQADIAMYQRNGAKTVELSQRVQNMDCGSRIRGLAAQREAQGHALLGDYDRCQAALDRAADFFDRPEDADTHPLLGSSTVRDPIGMAAAWCLHDLGRPGQAAHRLQAQLNQAPLWASRTRGRLGARYALSLLASGNIHHGCAALESALNESAGLGSATIRTDLREAAHQLNRHPSSPSARAILPRLTEVL